MANAKMKFTINGDHINQFKKSLQEIERWKGDAYQQDDEVDNAMQDIKTLLSVIVYGEFTEWCPHCENEQEVSKQIQDCPECGKVLVGCAMCSNQMKDGPFGCKTCTDGTSRNYDIDISEL